MPALNLLPFNIDLLILDENNIKSVPVVNTLDTFDKNSRNFSPQGLFSTTTFGRVGEERRNRLFGHIDLKVTVFHPLIYKTLVQLKSLYGDIMSGSQYAIFDKDKKDFVKATVTEGETGFAFFVKHFHDLVFEERDSDRRDFNIKLIKKYKEKSLMSKLLVMPAGLRDYEVDATGTPSKDEINDIYMKILSVSNIIDPTMIKVSEDMLDNTRYTLQIAVYDLYKYIEAMLEGKKKLVLGKWASRKVFNSTRNVITSMNNDTDELNSELTVGYNQTTVGLYQYMKSTLPIAIHHIRNAHLMKIFPGPNLPAVLVNPKTLTRELVTVGSEHYDDWMTDEGLEKTIGKFGEEDLRHLPLKIGKYCMGLIYLGDDMTFKFMQDITELPKGLDKSKVRPITFAELMYMSVYHDANTMPCFVTRYPITGYGSIYPGFVFLKTTVKSEVRVELDDDWQPLPYKAPQWPVTGESFVNSMSPHGTHLGRLGADFDRQRNLMLCCNCPSHL